MNLWLRTIIGLLSLLSVIMWSLVAEVPRTPYDETAYHEQMTKRLDSLEASWNPDWAARPIKVGWSKVSLTPAQAFPLAGLRSTRSEDLL